MWFSCDMHESLYLRNKVHVWERAGTCSGRRRFCSTVWESYKKKSTKCTLNFALFSGLPKTGWLKGLRMRRLWGLAIVRAGDCEGWRLWGLAIVRAGDCEGWRLWGLVIVRAGGGQMVIAEWSEHWQLKLGALVSISGDCHLFAFVCDFNLPWNIK